MTIDAAYTHFPDLTTHRLRLRQVQPTDAEALFAIKSDEEVTVAYGQEPHSTLDETRALIQNIQTLYDRRKAILWGITLKESDTIIGSCNFWNFSPDLHCAEIGYELHRAYWRQGIIAEAVSAVLTYGFTELELHRIEAVVDAGNTSSRNLLLKLGFTFEGNLRQRIFFRDHYEDEQYFGLLRDEWKESREKIMDSDFKKKGKSYSKKQKEVLIEYPGRACTGCPLHHPGTLATAGQHASY